MASPHAMSRFTYSSLLRMSVFLLLVSGLTGWLFPILRNAFLHNILMNTLIIGVILAGSGWCIWNQCRFIRDVKWLCVIQKGETALVSGSISTPVLLRPLHRFLQESEGAAGGITPQFVLETLDGRLHEVREFSHYAVRVLIFLGLLGTFWGLSQTVTSIAQVIGSVNISDQNARDAFQTLKSGLLSPLAGMGMAFSSSLFGLIGSIVVGFLDRENQSTIQKLTEMLEDFLQKISTRFPSHQGGALKNHGHAYTQGLLEVTAQQLNQLLQILRQTDDNRAMLMRHLQHFAEQLNQTVELFQQNQGVVKKLAQSHIELHELVKSSSQHQMYDQFRQFTKQFEQVMMRILEEMIEGRRRLSEDVRHEIRLVSQTLSALASGDEGI
jgi:hypothetical protein